MGYYTRYNLVALPEDNLKDADILNCLHHADPWEDFNDYPSFADWAEEPKKWCDCTYDMIHLFSCHPDTTFILTGIGESQGDVWKRYYKGGKCVQCIKAVLVFEENPILPEAQDYERVTNLFLSFGEKIGTFPKDK